MSATELGSQRSPAHQRFKPMLPTDLLHCAVYGSHSSGRSYLSPTALKSPSTTNTAAIHCPDDHES
ncbi:hypothetical protein K466DRAFT_607343 [Polyporus arcularius HHB13444]|uniref:Uncharacterized protein n=1 Tax=Polyporus arcularius HHB13444 TaxID=1314778 RepID=A0A5C3NLH8_9APHY|nr:hypothetical protein K466DRAFT_607343 [Polyporus arcularius HHB13444]